MSNTITAPASTTTGANQAASTASPPPPPAPTTGDSAAPAAAPACKPLSANEGIKTASNYLRGTIVDDVLNTATGAFTPDNAQLIKFHGFYEQDDRDQRLALRKAGKERAYSVMLRVRLPGGRCTAEQWRILDDLSLKVAGKHTLRLTTRQTFQFYGVLKGDVRTLIQGLNKALLDSIAACGDVNRNVMAPPNPERHPALQEVYEHAKSWSEFALPRTRAYHEIWIDDELVAGGEPKAPPPPPSLASPQTEYTAAGIDPAQLKPGEEPLYGTTYLPRKFKVGFAIPPSNDVDVFSQDLGFIAILENEKLTGYNVTVGGGMGASHGNEATFPRLGDLIGFITPDQLKRLGAAVLTTQRDYGDRVNRRHARLKYTIEDRGIAWFKAEVERRAGFALAPARPFEFTTIQDPHGWHACADGTWFYGLHLLSGRIEDREGWPMQTALREIAQIHTGDFRLTPSQNLTISGVTAEQKPRIEAILQKHSLSRENAQSALRLNALSCVALPTCPLALSESERELPSILEKFQPVFDAAGLRDQPVSIRVTGCPNGCARPFLAEIALVGKAPGKYAVYLGGNYTGLRLNRLVAASATVEESVRLLTPVIERYATERRAGEGFGDFCDRVIVPADATTHKVGATPLTPSAATQ
ncbi:NADPH-dependent assimilatory sulfite reductase hemoprotein subunit [Geminisphaera colitermitum]|uniref:NADPH-dependent assimilatory sulfite reductase hemoprotein subunit n=1 Tax=Geminisphaera colitermitum TaxID=1148786 RepID=UPI000158D49C|nr:NADPH-dependent assimilatory sulfite reductase hemoprotein subunit [Geminisphaera colitermitum]